MENTINSARKRRAEATAPRSPPGDTGRPVLGALNPGMGARSATQGGEVYLSVGHIEAGRGNP